MPAELVTKITLVWYIKSIVTSFAGLTIFIPKPCFTLRLGIFPPYPTVYSSKNCASLHSAEAMAIDLFLPTSVVLDP